MKPGSLLLLFIASLTMNFQCNEELQGRPFEQNFRLPVDIYPLKKSYTLTDTIWIETDLPTKLLFDTKTNQNKLADSGQITFGASFNIFGTTLTNPANGFCDIITANGVNTNRQLSPRATAGAIENFGCGQPGYRCKIGFKPNYKGTYCLSLQQNQLLGSCSNKVIPYYATIAYQYKNADLNLDKFNELPDSDKGGSAGIQFYTDKITNRECLIVRVE